MRRAGLYAFAAVAVLSAPCGLRAQEMAGHAHHAPAQADDADQPKGTDQSPGSLDAPAVAHDRAADRYWAPAAMERAEMAMMAAHSAPRYSAMKVDLAEYQLGKGGEAYRWEGEGWTGDVNRLLLRTRGEGQVGQRLDQAEIEVAYSRAISPWWNLQAGLRQDIRPTPARTHAMLALEGLAPYRFDLLAAAYISDRGEMTARFEASVDQRITRRWVLQPRAEIDLSAQDMPAARMGAGLAGAEIGLRLRYEISRKFAPYVGLSWNWAAGRSADYARAQGDSAATRAVVLGLKSWF
ncbi:MAG TPA: copper resistance protein B [Novosphingobium sp.]|nr:copper resistance protein B [Novosphingobium sp.]